MFLYTGEGQVGDMTFDHGNKAIRDHAESREEIHLFQSFGSGTVRYKGQMICINYHTEEQLDLEGNSRSAIVFWLVPVEEFAEDRQIDVPADVERWETSLAELRRKALGESTRAKSPKESLRVAHYRSDSVKKYVLARADGSCEACGNDAPFIRPDGHRYLVPHHIHVVSDDGPDHIEWVAAICPNCHARCHYSVDKDAYNSQLREKILKIEADLAWDD